MTIIGFDVSKNELVAVAITKRGRTIASYVVPNEKEAIDAFLDEQIETHPHLTTGSEATGEYHNVLARSCIGKGLPFFLLNPIVTKQFTRATVRKKKTDLSDAEVIAKCILQGEGERLLPSAFGSAKPILRTASRLAEMAVSWYPIWKSDLLSISRGNPTCRRSLHRSTPRSRKASSA